MKQAFQKHITYAVFRRQSGLKGIFDEFDPMSKSEGITLDLDWDTMTAWVNRAGDLYGVPGFEADG
ncbi:hypothetical protein D3877_09935 [Azospirillum cavernae]|uniref:Uncharacterized protein n=1 Tax=Azospirillum cavernae TaxID=2320860 RepID=A0A418W447_9PROT|nr:hypothetical protein [Azospirillum cavernae]RJF84792.1 hypothetical protein D3877_09935 [Azospirillum cavernae]